MRAKSLLPFVAILFAGCTLFQPRLAPRSPPYGAAYADLQNKSVAIVVYVPPATGNEYPGARDEVSSFIVAQMREHLPSVRLLAPGAVAAWQDDTLNWQALSGTDVGRHFGVDRVLYIEVLDYSTRDILRYSNLQGRLRALCKVYDSQTPRETAATGGTASLPPATGPASLALPAPVWTGLVDAAWPQERVLGPNETDENAVRQQTLEAFADQLVGHFYQP